MAFNVTNVQGEMSVGNKSDFGRLLDSLATADEEHPDISVTNDSGLALSIAADGFMVLENVEGEDPPPMWSRSTERSEQFKLMAAVAEGRLSEALGNASWQQGYGPTA